MKLIIDNADIQKIKKIYEFYPIDGVTTNPSILAESGKKPYQVLKEIREFIGREAQLHVQVVSLEASGMIREAHRIVQELGTGTYVKIPAVPEGFKAMKALHKDGILLTATAVYTPMQAFLGAKCGASYAAPYINRMDNMGYNGVAATKMIQDIFTSNGLTTQVLAASFKNSQQILELCAYGIGAATAAPEIIEGLVKNRAIEGAVQDFVKDFQALAGEGMDMSTC